MANSKYEYVKSFEVHDQIMHPNLIVVRIYGRNFTRFSEVHEFENPNDLKALHLMNACALKVMEEFPDLVFGYGFSQEYSFILKKDTKFYKRRASKIGSLIGSFFTSVYVAKWNEFFPLKELIFPPSFKSRVICCPSLEVLQSYISWRQRHYHIKNQYNTCFWMLIKSEKSEKEAKEILEGTQKQGKNELLFQLFGINYKNLPEIFRQGSCALKTEVEDIVKYKSDGTPVKRLRSKTTIIHSENVAARRFWNSHPILVKELGHFDGDIDKINPDYIRSFEFENKLMPSTWIVIRIDGCHFHRFSEAHEFIKPNDEAALNLMNSSAVAVMEEFNDIVFSYGVSDEYSFVLKEDSWLYERLASEIVSSIASFFTSVYVMKWKTYFPNKELKYQPHFDGRAVCYPSCRILQDYLAWRQVDCHINNQYNTCFWMLVNSGKSKSEAQNYLKGTQAKEKNELLRQQFGIDYNTLPFIFRHGSSVFWEKEEKMVINENEEVVGKYRKKLVVGHYNIIESSFWKAHPTILGESADALKHYRSRIPITSQTFRFWQWRCSRTLKDLLLRISFKYRRRKADPDSGKESKIWSSTINFLQDSSSIIILSEN